MEVFVVTDADVEIYRITLGRTSFSADRAQFIGRTGSQRSPAALETGEWWSPSWERRRHADGMIP